ncbi:MAG: hypothetical protein WD991_01200 [Candidatus Paceibacterota bacterium]
MATRTEPKIKKVAKGKKISAWAGLFFCLVLAFYFFPKFLSSGVSYESVSVIQTEEEEEKLPVIPPLDREAYDAKLIKVANNPVPKEIPEDPDNPTTTPVETKVNLWPVKTEYPLGGALLPFNRIIAYYGNLYSRKMGVLGEYPKEEMLSRLNKEVEKWRVADPETPVVPALHYIAVVAQGSPGSDGKYRFRMPASEIDKVLAIAEEIGAIVFLDIQVGLSNLESEIPVFEKYLKMPNVHLGVDPEFSMKTGAKPGHTVGTLDATDINFASKYLAHLVKENDLPPKILVVHRYTQKMLTNYQNIKTHPEVQIIMHMDGWGPTAKKINTYKQFVYGEPVQFTGFKLFYKNDLWDPGSTLATPEELLKLRPQPLYIQYQ